MKSIGVREAKEHITEWFRAAQKEPVLVMKHGKPTVIMIGVDGTDPTDAVLAEIHRRRVTFKKQSISDEELSEQLYLDPEEEKMWRRRIRAEMAKERAAKTG